MSQGSKSYVALASLVVVALACTLADAHWFSAKNIISLFTDLGGKLDAVAEGRKLTSGITIQELQEAFKMFKKSDQKLQQKIKQSHDLRLVLDFAVNPMRFFADDFVKDPVLFSLHLVRVETAYKRFKPAYAGQQIGDRAYRIKTNNSEKLYKLLRNPEAEITMLDFERFRMEANNWRARLEELTTAEDIFANLDELQSILNYFNFVVYKPLYDYINPNIEKTNNANQVRKVYYDYLWNNYQIKFDNGTPTHYAGAERLAQQAGFTDVITA